MTDDLPTPPEPVELKEGARKERERAPNLDLDSLYVWFGNRLPKVFWDVWKDKLKAQGITWPRFLKILSYCKGEIILWLRDQMTWEDLVKTVKDRIKKFGKLV